MNELKETVMAVEANRQDKEEYYADVLAWTSYSKKGDLGRDIRVDVTPKRLAQVILQGGAVGLVPLWHNLILIPKFGNRYVGCNA